MRNGLHATWHTHRGLAVMVGITVCLAAAQANATTYYVRTTGVDTNDGLTAQAAFQSIRTAARFLLNPGDRVVVGPGEYHEADIEPRRGGATGQPVEFVADPTGALTGDPAGEVRIIPSPAPAARKTAFLIFGKHHLRIQGFTILGAADPAIQVRPAAQSGGSSGDLSIVGNTFRGGNQAIEIQATGPVEIKDNHIDGSGFAASVVSDPASRVNVVIDHNVLTNNMRGLSTSGAGAVTVTNNEFESNVEFALNIFEADAATIDNNTVHGGRIGLVYVRTEDGPASVSITRNTLNQLPIGLSVRGTASNSVMAMIAGNTVAPFSVGIALREVEQAQVSSNEINGGYRGIGLYGGGLVNVEQGQFTGCSRGISLAGKIGQVTVTHSRFESCGTGVRGDTTGNVSVGSSQFIKSSGVRVSSRSVDVVGNHFENAAGGVTLNASTVHFLDNQLVGVRNAVVVSGAAAVEVARNDISGSVAGVLVTATMITLKNNSLSGVPQPGELRGQRILASANRWTGARHPFVVHDAVDVRVEDNELSGPGSGMIYESRRSRVGSAHWNRNVLKEGASLSFSGELLDMDVEATFNRIEAATLTAMKVRTRGSVDLSDNVIVNPVGNGIQLQGAGGDAVVNRNQIDGGVDGISLENWHAVAVAGNVLAHPRQHGLRISNIDTAVVDANHVSDSGNDAINIAGEAILVGDCNRDGVVSGAELQRVAARVFDADPGADCSAAMSGDVVSSADLVRATLASLLGPSASRPAREIEVADNTVGATGGVGIVAFATDQMTAQRNVVSNASRSGISLVVGTSGAATVESNRVDAGGGDGLAVSGAAVLNVSSNEVGGSAGSGLRLRDAGRVFLANNHVADTGGVGIRASHVGHWTSRGNQIDATGGGISLFGARPAGLSAALEDERIGSSRGVGLLVDQAALVSLSASEVRDTAADGVVLRHTNVVRITDSVVSGAAGTALRLGDAEAATGDDIVLERNRFGGFHGSGVDARPVGKVLVRECQMDAATEATGAGIVLRYAPMSTALAVVSGNRIRGGGGDGIFVENAGRAIVWDNQVYSARQTGVLLRGLGATEVVNTLAYDNGEDAVRLEQPGEARVFNNTLYANGRWGLASADATSLRILNNILDGNVEGSLVLGIGDSAAAQEGFNLTTGMFVGLTPAATDVMDAPAFADPNGADGVLGGDGADDDDFHLRMQPASPAIDAGSDTAVFFGISGSALGEGLGDSGPVDLGYHYDPSPRVP